MNETSARRVSTTGRFGHAWGVVAFLVFHAFLIAPAFAGDTGFGDPVQGQAVFQAKRGVRCYAVRGAGGRIGPDLGRKAVKGSFFEIAAGMWNHSPAMGEKMREYHLRRPSFEGSELADLAAFLYFLKYFDEPGDPRLGKTLFTEKHCIRCHKVGGQGGDMGGRLDTLPRGVSPLRIAQDLWNHGHAMVTAMEMQSLDVPTFEGSEIIDLMAYLRSQGQRGATREFQSAGDPEKGKSVFKTKGCARCHGIFGSRPRLGPDLGSGELRGSVTQIAGRMWNHWPAMAQAMENLGMARPEFEGEDLADLFAYIFIARYQGQAGNPRRGESVYSLKGCAFCHRPDGTGEIGPSLRDIATETKETTMKKMWNHAPLMWEEMGERRIPWPRFEAEELSDLLAFLAAAWTDESPSPEGHR
jgi:cytochrome c551/c552